MSNQKEFYSFKKWCLDTDNIDLLNLWDYELNNCIPEEIGHMSTQKVWLKCPRCLHDSNYITLQNIVKSYNKGKTYCICKKCNSIGQYIVDNYGEEYLLKIWSDKNDKNAFDISRRSNSRIWLRCLNDDTHPDYDLMCGNFYISHNCPYCCGKRICRTNSIGYKIPQSITVWSALNKKTPFEYTPGCHDEVYWKCENNKHDDYKRMISRTVTYNFRCPICGRENQYNPSGENHPNWKGDAVSEDRRIRYSPKYKQWRENAFIKDDYTCQCCGKRGGRLNVHHLKDFATYKELRFDINNSITLCESCHDSTIPNSFHNIYGTHGKTEQELEEYINNKRKQLGINIPFSIEEYKNGNILKPEDIDNISLGTWIFDICSPSELKSKYKKIKVA